MKPSLYLTSQPGRRSALAAFATAMAGVAGSTLLGLGLTGCQARAPAPAAPGPAAAPKGFSQRQTDLLREYGFAQNEDGWELQMSGKLLFDFDSDRLDATSRALVERLGRGLSSVGIDRLRVEGHTDDQGSDAYNERLSLRRAQAVAQVLSEVGIPPAGIAVQGLGRSRPLVSGSTDSGRRENRRVAVIVPAP